MSSAKASKARCLIPRFDGAILSQAWKEALSEKFVTGAARLRTPSELILPGIRSGLSTLVGSLSFEGQGAFAAQR